MEQSFNLKILSPEKPLADISAGQIQAPGADGEMGILPGHTALISALKPGILSVWESKSQDPVYYYVGGGYLQFCDNQAVILAEVIDTRDELDQPRVDAAEKRALERLAKTSDEAIDIGRALNALERAKARKKLLTLG